MYGNQYDEHVYKKCPVRLTWDQARLECYHDGSQLVSMNSVPENDHVLTHYGA